MKLATLFLLLAASAASVSAQQAPAFYSYMPQWLAHRMGHHYVQSDIYSICVTPKAMDAAPMYFAELSWDSSVGRSSVSFMVYPDPSKTQSCKMFQEPPLANPEIPPNILLTVTPLMQLGREVRIGN